jgi:hypothetical protein
MAIGIKISTCVLAMAAALAVANAADAQSAAVSPARADNATPVTLPGAQVQAASPQETGPTFRLFGIPIRLSAPVPPPYAATSFDNLGGQPMNSVDQTLSQQDTDQKR